MERVKKLKNSMEESLGIREAVCMESVVQNWRDPTHRWKLKRKRISLAKVYFWWEGVGEEYSTDNDCAKNAVYGKVPYFIHVCREGKSERMSWRLTTPKKKFDNFKTNYIWQPRSVTAEDFMHFTIKYIGMIYFSKHGNQEMRPDRGSVYWVFFCVQEKVVIFLA